MHNVVADSSLSPAFIAYRLKDISVSRLSLAVCTVLLTHGLALAQSGDALVVKRSPTDPKRFTCDIGFATFVTPKGWSVNRSDKPTYAILTPEGESYPKITKMISIDAGKPATPEESDSKKMAQAFAKKWKGSVLDEPVKVDGEVGYRVTCEPTPNQLRPIQCVVVMKSGRAILLIAGALKTGDTDEALKELVASWKWKEGTVQPADPKAR